QAIPPELFAAAPHAPRLDDPFQCAPLGGWRSSSDQRFLNRSRLNELCDSVISEPSVLKERRGILSGDSRTGATTASSTNPSSASRATARQADINQLTQ